MSSLVITLVKDTKDQRRRHGNSQHRACAWGWLQGITEPLFISTVNDKPQPQTKHTQCFLFLLNSTTGSQVVIRLQKGGGSSSGLGTWYTQLITHPEEDESHLAMPPTGYAHMPAEGTRQGNQQDEVSTHRAATRAS